MLKILHWNTAKSYDKLDILVNDPIHSDTLISINEVSPVWLAAKMNEKADEIESGIEIKSNIIEVNERSVIFNKHSCWVIPKRFLWKNMNINMENTVGIKLIIRNRQFYLISTYRHQSTKDRFFCELGKVLETITGPVIICGDMNAECSLWSPRKPIWNKYCENTFKEFLKSAHQPVEDNYTFQTGTLRTFIDCQLYSENWLLLEAMINKTNSDHNQLQMVVLAGEGEKIRDQWVIRLKKYKLSSDMVEYHDGNLTVGSQLIQVIQDIINFPIRNGKWYNQSAKFTTRGYRRKIKTVDIEEKSELRRKFDNLDIKGLKSKSFWRLIDTIRKDNHVYVLSESEYDGIYKDSISQQLKKFTRGRMGKAVPRGKRFKSSLNSDGFTKRTWEKFFKKNIVIIRRILEIIFELSYIPECMRISGAGMVPKSHSNKVRMVKSPNYLFKSVDKIISYRLLDICDEFILENTQFAFKRNTSREDLILQMTFQHDWQEVKLLLLDVTAAFDRVSMIKLIPRIEERDSPLANIIGSFCSRRWTKIIKDKKPQFCEESVGTPQGSSSGPLLYILALDSQIRALRKRKINIQAYADDLIVYLDPNDDEKSVIADVENHLKEINLTLNLEKTQNFCKKFHLMKFLGFRFLIPFDVKQIKQTMMEMRSELLASFRCKPKTLSMLPMKTKRLIISNIVYPKLRLIGYSIFLTVPSKFIKLFHLMDSTLSLLERSSTSGSFIWNYYNIDHLLEKLWMESLIYGNGKETNIRDEYTFESLNPPEQISSKIRKKIIEKFITMEITQSLEYFTEGDSLFVGVGSFNMNAFEYTLKSEWDNYLIMIQAQLVFMKEEEEDHVLILPEKLQLSINSKSTYVNDAFAIINKYGKKNLRWTYGNYIKYKFTPRRITKQIIGWLSTKRWKEEIRLEIRARICKWLRDENDVIATIMNNIECYTNEYGYLGQTHYCQLMNILSKKTVNLNNFNCCPNDQRHHPFTCSETLNAALIEQDTNYKFTRNFKINLSNVDDFILAVNIVISASGAIRNSFVLFL
ncbi:uncharacterized protein LOC128397135 [Panonychus citri]|uniref:uncharacterized protein LOC128397135 n=1 Tax=Panonychus citri TaxID=50023 RepID=UPI00230779DE|nr:uncharacterized protein LOC128397135 [Panonychus citri]